MSNKQTRDSIVTARESSLGRGKQLIIIVGNIASGKSSISRTLSCLRFMQVVSLDAMRYMLGGGDYYFGGDVEKVIWKAEMSIVKDLMKFKYNIIIDDAKSVSALFRQPLIELAKRYKYKVIVVETPTSSKKDSVARRVKESHGDVSEAQWSRVYDKFKRMYNKPSKAEGIYDIIKMTDLHDKSELFLKIGVK